MLNFVTIHVKFLKLLFNNFAHYAAFFCRQRRWLHSFAKDSLHIAVACAFRSLLVLPTYICVALTLHSLLTHILQFLYLCWCLCLCIYNFCVLVTFKCSRFAHNLLFHGFLRFFATSPRRPLHCRRAIARRRCCWCYYYYYCIRCSCYCWLSLFVVSSLFFINLHCRCVVLLWSCRVGGVFFNTGKHPIVDVAVAAAVAVTFRRWLNLLYSIVTHIRIITLTTHKDRRCITTITFAWERAHRTYEKASQCRGVSE